MSRLSLILAMFCIAIGCKKRAPEDIPQVDVPPSAPVARPTPPEPPPTPSATPLHRIHFAYDSAALSAEAKRHLTENATLLTANAEVRVEVQGHCDERGTTEYNMALGQRRAQAAKAYLIAQGVAASRLTTVSYGEERPTSMGSDEAAWAANRRGELRLLTEVAGLEGTVR